MSSDLPRQFLEEIELGADLGDVVVRGMTPADAEAFAAHVGADLTHLGQYLAWPAKTANVEGAAKWLGLYQPPAAGAVAVVGAWRNRVLVGGGVLFHRDPAQAIVELGVWMTSSAEGHGLASAVCRKLLACARRDLGAERVEWRSPSENERSRRLATKLSFVYEGTLRSSFVLRDQRLDIDVFALVGDELDRAIDLEPTPTWSS